MVPSWWVVAIAGLFVGFVAAMTGMGGGALMTPMMNLLFGVQPLAGRVQRPGCLDDHEAGGRRRPPPQGDRQLPLVASASLGHLLFGDFQLDLTASLLIGALPGVYLGPGCPALRRVALVRRALVVVLLASGLKLLDASGTVVFVVLVAVAVIGPVLWATVYRKALPDIADTRQTDLLGVRLTNRAPLREGRSLCAQGRVPGRAPDRTRSRRAAGRRACA